MRDCLGGWYNEGIGDDPPPTKDESGYWNALEQVDHEPGFEICEDCRVEYYNAFAQLEMDDIANEFWVGMCKRHSLEHFRRRPIMNYCRCFDLLDGSWQCNECRIDTFGTLEMRMDAWKSELLYMRCKRGRRGRVLADRTERRVHPACPIPKCGGRPWMNESAIERMDMCTACCGVQPYLWYDQAQQMEE